MKQIILCCLLLGVVGLSACDTTADATPTVALPEPPTLPPGGTTAVETAVSVSPTAAALPTSLPAPTDLPATEPPTVVPPTEEPSPEPATATSEPPTAEPTTPPAQNQMAPGQRDTATLAENEFRTYLYSGAQYQPAVFFAEPGRDLDIELLALAGQVTPESGLDGLTPLSGADNALAGRPEILVLSPEGSGLYTFVVRAASGAGEYTAYLFDMTSPATGMAVQQADALAAGETKSYDITSNGARPVIAMVDPTDLSDVALDVFGSDGSLLTTANFSGPGGVEVAYVLPLGTAGYTVAVREVNNAPSTFNVAVVTLE
ncbi:MAG: hypothetical protein R3C44_02655 [Chloroflexota bacterium]